MRKEEKAQIIDQVAAQLSETPNFYVTDISGLNAENTTALRRACFEKEIKLMVVKNTLFIKALERIEGEAVESIKPIMEGSSAIMFTTTPNSPAKLIKEYGEKMGKPVLKVRIAPTSVLRTSRFSSTSSPVRNSSETSSVCCSLLHATSSPLCRHLPAARLQDLSRPYRKKNKNKTNNLIIRNHGRYQKICGRIS